MKTKRDGSRIVRRDGEPPERVADPYEFARKPKEPAQCPECRATFHGGRWTWVEAPPGAHEHLCPACHRVRDNAPAGYVTLTGPFLAEHLDEILHLVRNCESREKAEHPLERIIAIEHLPDRVLVTTTGTHLAREVAGKVHHAYQGELDLNYSEGENLVRATWRR